MGKKVMEEEIIQKPIILYEGKNTPLDIVDFKNTHNIWKELDIYQLQLEELFEILNPQLRFSSNYAALLSKFISEKLKKQDTISGNWIYFPWNGYLIHTVNEKEFVILRTNRNREIITSEEQGKLMNAYAAFVGLSIGSLFAVSLAYSSMANSMKLAELDIIATSNLNRVRAGLKDVGSPKINVVAQQIYEINPYASLQFFDKGLNNSNISDFVNGDKKPAVIFEAIDDFEMKIRLRLEARKAKISVIMFTNLGDNLLIDIERFDQNPNLPLFNGLIGNVTEEILHTKISEKEKIVYAVKIVGIEHVPARALDSLLKINKTLVGRPQLFSTVNVAAGLASFLFKKLVLDNSLKSGRYYLSFDEILRLQDKMEEKSAVNTIV